jgi:60S ribosome subunit biogenesis protein NIP7
MTLYENPVIKSMLARITENNKGGDEVVVSISDIPLGFRVAVRLTQNCRKEDLIVVHHQADNGEHLRNEEELSVCHTFWSTK